MLVPNPQLVPLVLSEEERRVLEGWTRRRTTAQALALRARIVLACAESGESNTVVAQRLNLSRHTVGTWRARFLRDRLDGLSDEPRPGRPRTISDAQVEQVAGVPDRHVAVGGIADLAGVRVAAASAGLVEAEQGPAVHRQGP